MSLYNLIMFNLRQLKTVNCDITMRLKATKDREGHYIYFIIIHAYYFNYHKHS